MEINLTWTLEREFKLNMVNEPSVFEPLKTNCM